MKKSILPLALLCASLSFMPNLASAQENPYLPSSMKSLDSGISKSDIGKTLDEVVSEIIIPQNYKNNGKFTYSLHGYWNRGGYLTIDTTSYGSLELDIKMPVPYMGSVINSFLSPLRTNLSVFKKSAKFSNENDSTHIQSIDQDTENEEIYTYKLRNGHWVLTECKSNREKKRNLIGSVLSGKNPVDLICEKFSGGNILYAETFFSGLDYEGKVNSIINSDEERLNINADDFYLHEGGAKIPLAEDREVVIGDIVASFYKNELRAVVTKFRPKYFLSTDVKMIREYLEE